MKSEIAYIKKQQRRISKTVTENFKTYYLTGGTALSFYFNHRFSEDLDFFSQKHKQKNPERIMKFVSKKTGFDFKLEAEQNDPELIPMKVYFLQLEKNNVLKIDFVQDFQENIKRVRNGLHSIEDIYFRKLTATMGFQEKRSITGDVMATGRQTAKDLFDVYYLSKHYKPVSDFFFEYFSYDKAERLIGWFKSFNRMELKLELLDLVAKVDTAKILKHLDDEILKKLPDKLMT